MPIKYQKQGFTLMELLVAVAVSGIVVATAFTCYGMYREGAASLLQHYQTESDTLLKKINRQIRSVGCDTNFSRY
ncbi:MAG: prepilin-type N-terminal cleavage/methylation domain-containing protein [Fibrobacteraceae bacterium]|nr:prepilin-type N-terminal cleavage/methylation domain-containing protein [Fibrobacteraceae bacterium]